MTSVTTAGYTVRWLHIRRGGVAASRIVATPQGHICYETWRRHSQLISLPRSAGKGVVVAPATAGARVIRWRRWRHILSTVFVLYYVIVVERVSSIVARYIYTRRSHTLHALRRPPGSQPQRRSVQALVRYARTKKHALVRLLVVGSQRR